LRKDIDFMKIQSVNSNVSMGRKKSSSDPILSYEYEQYRNRKIVPVDMKYKDIQADYAVIDTFRDKNGYVKMRKVSFINREDFMNANKSGFLDDIV